MKILRIAILFSLFSLTSGQNWIQSQVLERQFNQALSNYNNGRYATSETILNQILLNEPGVFEEPVLLLLLKSQVGFNKNTKARETSSKILTKFPKSKYLANVMESLGDLYVNETNYSSAYRMYHRSISLSINPEYSQKIDMKLLKLIQIGLSSSLLNELLILEPNPKFRNIHLIARANSEILSGRPDDAAITLNKVDPTFLPDIYALFFENLLRASYKPSSPVLMVGIVLPLSGDQIEEGEAFLTGFYEGEKSVGETKQRLSILVQDSRSTNLQAIMQAQNLEKMNQLKALICSLDDQASLAVTSALSSTNIPIILTNLQRDDLSKIYNKSFHFYSTLAMQGRMAARYIVSELGLSNIAVIAPANQDGEIQTDSFIRELDHLGSNVVATEWYSGEPINLKRQFKSLRQVAFDLLPKEENYDEALGMDIDSLDALFDVSAEDFFDLPKQKKKKMTSSDSAKVFLNTIQAIYLPINKSDLEFIGPQIPMYNLDAKLIGNGNWQNLNILQKDNIGPHLKGLSLLTNFFHHKVDSIDYEGDQLNAYYRGYNTAKILIAIDLENQSRQSLNQSLKNINFHVGEGFYYSPSVLNKQVNSAFQLLEFDGEGFIHQGVFQGDSLQLVLPQNP